MITHMKSHLSSLILGCGGLFLFACTPETPPAGNAHAFPPVPNGANVGVSFVKEIKPILSNKCTICHNSQVLPRRPNFEVGEKALRSGVIVPGNPDASRILTVVQEEHGAAMTMPPVAHRLTQEEIALLRRWIKEGAPWPIGSEGRVKPAFIPRE